MSCKNFDVFNILCVKVLIFAKEKDQLNVNIKRAIGFLSFELMKTIGNW